MEVTAVLKSSSFFAALLAGLTVCMWLEDSSVARAAQIKAVRVTSVALKVTVDRSSPCKLSLSATIETSGKGTVWYRFDGPPGTTFDFGAEGTHTLEFATSFGAGKGVTLSHDIKGEFRVQAAMVEPNGTHGPVTFSNIVPAFYTCGDGSSIANPMEDSGSTAENQEARGAARVTEVRLEVVPADYSGPCPAKVQLIGTIVADGPGKAYYEFQAGAVGANREGTVNFSAAGTETVTSEGQVRNTPQVREVRFLAGMEPRGNQENAEWIDAPLNINCGGGGNVVGRQNPPAGIVTRSISLPSGTQVDGALQDAKLNLKLEEQVAFLFVQSIGHLERDECPHQLNRLCTLEEAISGVAGSNGQIIGLAPSPDEDVNYLYTLTISGTDYQIAATPRNPGLGGFLYVGKKGFGGGDFYYNPAGPASTRDESLRGWGYSGKDFRRR